METAGASFFLNLLGFIYKLIPLKAVIKVEVVSLKYTALCEDPDSPVVVISPYPSRYGLQARVSHLRGRKTTLRDVFLTINETMRLDAIDFESFMLNPGEMKDVDLTFPIKEAEAINAGDFEVVFLDIYGKKSKAKGKFPM